MNAKYLVNYSSKNNVVIQFSIDEDQCVPNVNDLDRENDDFNDLSSPKEALQVVMMLKQITLNPYLFQHEKILLEVVHALQKIKDIL